MTLIKAHDFPYNAIPQSANLKFFLVRIILYLSRVPGAFYDIPPFSWPLSDLVYTSSWHQLPRFSNFVIFFLPYFPKNNFFYRISPHSLGLYSFSELSYNVQNAMP